jgi:hypothetical protein
MGLACFVGHPIAYQKRHPQSNGTTVMGLAASLTAPQTQ